MSVVERLIIFTRYPEPGRVKTRLIPALGAVESATVYRQMVEHTLVQAQKLQFVRPLCVEIRFTGGNRDLMRRWLGTDLMYTVQGEGDLGERMGRSLQSGFNSGATSVVLIGTDCPQLDGTILEQAFQLLQNQDLVLGPALDGGYYLIGLRRYVPELFQDIAWSTSQVLAQTQDIAQGLGLAIADLPPLSDIDQPEDLVIWEQVKQQSWPTSKFPSL
jgi:rSAM/selenodomain-associated transferase 1